MSKIIIHRPDLQSYQQKYGQGLITFLFWILFFFFMRPFIGIVGWIFGLQLFTDVMVVQGGYQSLLELLGWYFAIILLMGLALKGWGIYNLLRYGRHEKRTGYPRAVTVQEQAEWVGVGPMQISNWQAERRIVMVHDERGHLVEVGMQAVGPATGFGVEESVKAA